MSWTTMSTVAADVRPPGSDTVSRNVRVSCAVGGCAGAVNEGAAVFAPASTTDVPAVCTQAYDSGSPSGSLLPVPSSVIVAPSCTVLLAPASAMGAWLSRSTTTSTVAFPVSGPPHTPVVVGTSVTASWNLSVTVCATPGTPGATNDGVAVVAFARVTAGPAICVHAYDSGSACGS